MVEEVRSQTLCRSVVKGTTSNAGPVMTSFHPSCLPAMKSRGPAEASRPRYAQSAYRGESAKIAASSAVIRRVLRWRRHGCDDDWWRTGVQRRGPQEQLFGAPFVPLFRDFAPPRHPKSLLQSASAPHQRVGNVVSFPARIRTSANSKRLGNGEGRPRNQDVRPCK